MAEGIQPNPPPGEVTSIEVSNDDSPPSVVEEGTNNNAVSEEPPSADNDDEEPPSLTNEPPEEESSTMMMPAVKHESIEENEPGLAVEPSPMVAAEPITTNNNLPMGSLLDDDESDNDNDEQENSAPTAEDDDNNDDFVHVDNMEDSNEDNLRDEESKVLNGAEILFSRSTKEQYNGWDNLRWMAYSGTRKLVFFETVYRYNEKPKSFMNFLAGEEYSARKLAVYEEPSVILLLRSPENMDELKSALCVEHDSQVDTTNTSYWIVEAVVDTNTCKLRLSSLTTVTSIVKVQENEFRRKSCFELITPLSSIVLSAIQLRHGGAVKTSFIDSGAFLETSSAELVLQKVVCNAHRPKEIAPQTTSDLSWKHQIILGTLHSYVILGNKDLLDQGIAKARKAQELEARRMGESSSMAASKYLDPRIIDAFDESGKTPLHYACANRFTMGVLSLVSAGANLDLRMEPYHLTPCHLCAQKLDDKSLMCILQQNRRPNVVDEFGRTPMYLAITEGHTVGGMADPKALDRCLAVLDAHGGDLGDLSTFMHPICHHARMWNHESLAVVLRHVHHRYPLFPPNGDVDDRKRIGISASANFHYPIHSALISFRENLKMFCEDRDPQELHSLCVDAEARLSNTLQTLYSCGFEPNERIETILDQFNGSEQLSSYVGFAPIQILYRAGLDVLEHKDRIPETSHKRIVDTIGKLAEFMVSKGTQFAMDVPLSSRPRATDSEVIADNAKLVERSDQLKIESNKQLTETLGGIDRLKAAQKSWEVRKPVSTESKAFVFHTDNKSLIDNSLAPGGSDEKSCFVCWKQFGKLVNRKHRCRITKRYICDFCSSKRILSNGEEHRVSDGQYLSAMLAGTSPAPKPAPPMAAKRAGSGGATDAKTNQVTSRLDKLEAAEQANRDSLFGSFIDNASKAVFGEEEEADKAAAQAEGLSGLSNQLGETRNMLHQRGEKLNTLAEKSDKLASASEDFASMAKKLNQQSQGGFFW
ncbi:unnamed protein product [Cylindrotheca closterium]|uniref:V-SNARE coiled-coil homology domain-containing protein n=1 Tax=Cylindrotheca closterium TaxID=2856 RepID=A0AAD2FQF5_9STRA|nr:unnamed protein product [Cylindrotheca closterium]